MPRIVLQEGVSIHCAIDDYLRPWDDRRPVMMMHGFARNALFWNRWVPPIAETHRIYRPDLLGCGLSDQPRPKYHYTPDTIDAQIIGVLDAFSLPRVHWVGESSGGLIGLLLAAAHPERVASLVLCNTPFAHSGSNQTHLRAGSLRRRGCDVGTIEVGVAFLRLYHGHDDDLVVGMGHVVGAAVVHGADGPRRAHADGRIAARGHRHRRFRGGIDQRYYDAIGAKVQGLHDGRRLVPCDPHDRDRFGLRDRLQQGTNVIHFSGAMLQVDAQSIEALTRHDLGREPMGHGKPAQRHVLTGSPHLLDLVWSHGHTSSVVH